ncbi:MAG: hypothetical protein LBQ33_03225, partial [Oscillospiraceae bacterium]|nr:hypothetical protein [Oscillospiraceae bacterium]
MKKKFAKRSLSLLLSLLMVVGVLAVGLEMSSPEVAAAEGLAVTAPPAVPPTGVVFGAPEVIYLKPTTATTTQWQYFADDAITVASTVTAYPTSLTQSATDTTGSLYFYCPNATSVTVEIDWDFTDPATGKGTSDVKAKVTTRYCADGSALNGDYDDIQRNGIVGKPNTWSGTWVNYELRGDTTNCNNESKLIRWKATYVVDGVTYVSYTYSYLYAPYWAPYGAAATMSAGTRGSQIAFASGVHSVNRQTLTVGSMLKNYSNGAHVIADFASPDFTGTGENDWGTRKHVLPLLGKYNQEYGDETWIEQWLVGTNSSTWFKDSTGSFGYISKNEEGTGFPAERTQLKSESPYGVIYVDKSRYTSASQIPNLSWYVMVVNARNTGDRSGEGSGVTIDSEYGAGHGDIRTGAFVFGQLNSGTVTGHVIDYKTSLASYRKTGAFEVPTSGLTTWGTSDNHRVVFRGRYHSGSMAFWLRNTVWTNFKAVDKSALRTKLHNEISAQLYASDKYITADWNNYQGAVQALATALCQPDAALANAASVTTLVNAVTTARSKLTTYTATQVHKLLDGTTLTTPDYYAAGNGDSVSYRKGDTVSAERNKLKGYDFSHMTVKIGSGAETTVANHATTTSVIAT